MDYTINISPALFSVGIEQRVDIHSRIGNSTRELPREIVGVLNSRIHSLTAGGTVEMGSVASQQRGRLWKSRRASLVLMIHTPPDGLPRWDPEEAPRKSIDMLIDRLIVDAQVNGVRDDPEDAITEADADYEPLVHQSAQNSV